MESTWLFLLFAGVAPAYSGPSGGSLIPEKPP
jgi:hypothetical protein